MGFNRHKLRPFQARLVENVGSHNAIIKMPTGSGKTIVAAELIRRSLERHPSLRILFLVPTCELVSQQRQVIEKWSETPHVAGFTGGMADPDIAAFSVLVATPAAFVSLKVRKQYCWSWFRMVVFDECHHVLKDHPYRTIALSLKDFHADMPLQVLGLSASLTYQIADEAIHKTLERLCYELNIQKMESPTPEELEAGGYIAQKRGDNLEIDISSDGPEGVLPRNWRQPHLMYETFRKRVERGEATKLATLVWQVAEALEEHCAALYPAFGSPLKDMRTVGELEDYTHKIGCSIVAKSIGLSQELLHLEVWYVALRVLVTTWEEDEQVVLQWLSMSGTLVDTNYDGETLRKVVVQVRDMAGDQYNYFKWNRLKHHL